MQSQTADRFFDGYAHDFDAIYGTAKGPLGHALDRIFRRSMLLRYERSIEGCQPIAGRSALDVGCGPGHYAVALAKKGAARVVGVDFAESMLQISRQRAEREGVAKVCEFVQKDVMDYTTADAFDYTVICGVMDYIANPEPFVKHILSLTKSRAFFSFPKADGVLAHVRAYRYRRRTPLYLYDEDRLHTLFGRVAPQANATYRLEKLARDYFVTVQMP